MTSSLNLDSIKPHLLPITAALVVVATVPLVIMPWVGEIMSDYEEIGIQSELRDRLVAKANELDSFDVANSKDILESTIEPALPAEADPAGALGTLELIAQKVDARIVGVTYTGSAPVVAQPAPEPVTPDDAASADQAAVAYVEPEASLIDATITLVGSFPSLVSFVAESEKVSRVVNINTLHFTKGDSAETDVTASFRVSAPYMPHPTDLGPIDTPFPQLQSTETRIIDMVNSYNKSTFAPTNIQNITGKANPF